MSKYQASGFTFDQPAIGIISGVRIIFSEHAGEYKTRWVRRGWFERLFSLPWRPFQRERPEHYIEPGIYRVGDMIVAHESFRAAIEKEFK